MKVALALLSSLALAAPALAEPPGLTQPSPRPLDEPLKLSRRSENLATGFTLAGIVLPSALIYEGMRESADPRSEDGDGGLTAMGIVLAFPGPAVGHWYAGHLGGIGLLARAVGIPLFLVGDSHLGRIERCGRGEVEASDIYCKDLSRTKGRAYVATGLALTVGSWVYDLITSRREIARFNATRAFVVAPTVLPGGAGAAVAGSF